MNTRLAPTDASPDWESALCAQIDPDLFFPDGMGKQITTASETAKRVCGQCPIRSACLSWALDTGQIAGVWGGLDENERRVMRVAAKAGRRTAVTVCVESRQYIEGRLSQHASQTQIAAELGVRRKALAAALALFEEEQAEQVEEVAPV